TNLVLHFSIDDLGMNPGLIALLFAKPPGTNERYFNGICRVRTLDGSSPNPGDNGVFSSSFCFYLRIKVTDPLLGFVAHPLALATYIVSEPLGSSPPSLGTSRSREYWLLPCKLRRYFDECFGNENSKRIEITGMSLQTETLRFQRNRPATRERIKDCGETTVVALTNLFASLLEKFLVIAVLPHH